MNCAVISDPNPQRSIRDFNSVQLGEGNTSADSSKIVHSDFVSCRLPMNNHFECRPALWNTRVEIQEGAADAQPENAFDTRALHPTRRACVPCPPAASHMRRGSIDIGR